MSKIIDEEEFARLRGSKKIKPPDLRKIMQAEERPKPPELKKPEPPREDQKALISALTAISQKISSQGNFNAELVDRIDKTLDTLIEISKKNDETPHAVPDYKAPHFTVLPIEKDTPKRWRFTVKRYEDGTNKGKIESIEASTIEE